MEHRIIHKNMNCKQDIDILTIPRGNPFLIHLCRKDVAPNNPDDVDFSAIDGMKCYITTPMGARVSVETKVENGDLLLSCPADLRLTTYGIELVGEYNGFPWRYKRTKAFRIVDSNCESSVQGMESFGVETYYLNDALTFEIEGDTLHIYTDGHASLDGGTLSLQETANMSLAVKGDSIIATELKSIPR